MNIIEPCCAERQIGKLLREAPGNAVMFQTNGDVTAKTFIKETMLLSGDRPRTLTIAANALSKEVIRLVERYASLGYIAVLRLMLPNTTLTSTITSTDSQFSVADGQCSIANILVELAVLPDGVPVPELMMWSGSTDTIVIQGAMPDKIIPALHLYSGILCKNKSIALRYATDAFEALFRARKTDVEEKKEVVKPSPKKRTTRKKTKKDEVESIEEMEGPSPSEKETEGAA